MCLIKAKDKRKHVSKRYGAMSKVTKTEFCWTDDEIQLLLQSVNQFKSGPPEQGGRGGVSPPNVSVDGPFFADEPFKCALFEKTNKKCT